MGNSISIKNATYAKSVHVESGENIRLATSATLAYKLPTFSVDGVREVQFKNKISILKSYNHTYFSVIQFWPGGYCGLQQLSSENDKIAIFSVWNEPKSNVELSSCGDGVCVQTFGGEGTGLKSMKKLNWKIGEIIEFTVTSCRLDSDSFSIRCGYSIDASEQVHMATFNRKGANPMQAFNCFIEDFNRCSGACGINFLRQCRLLEASCMIDGKHCDLNEVNFSRGDYVHELEGNSRCSAEIEDSGCFILRTGGPQPYESCCCNHTKLYRQNPLQ